MSKFKKAFSLVELVVVIAILSILAITSFVVLSQWFVKSRNIKRISDLQGLKTALNSYYYSNFKYPRPGESIEIRDENDEVIGYQGLFDESVGAKMREVTKVPKDPLDKEYYGYSVLIKNGVGYELVSFLEVIDTNLLGKLDNAYAISLSSRVPYVIGEYEERGEFHLKPLTFIHPDYGVITSNILGSGGYVKIDSTTLTGYESSGGVVGGVNIGGGEYWVAEVIEVGGVNAGSINKEEISQALPVVGGVNSTNTVDSDIGLSNYVRVLTGGGNNIGWHFNDINTDGGLVYVVGYRYNTDNNISNYFVSKLDVTSGINPLWARFISGARIYKVIPYGGNIYVFGETNRSDQDIFVAKFDGNGNLLSKKAIYDLVSTNFYDALIDNDNIFILGHNYNGRSVLIKSDLNLIWSSRLYFGSGYNYQARWLVKDKTSSDLYLGGYTSINKFSLYKDFFWSQISQTGLITRTRHFGVSGDYSPGSIVDVEVNNGIVYIAFSRGTLNFLKDDKNNVSQYELSGAIASYGGPLIFDGKTYNNNYILGGVLKLSSKNTCYGVVLEKDLDNGIVWSKRIGVLNEGLFDLGIESVVKLSNGTVMGVDGYGGIFKTWSGGGAGYIESGLFLYPTAALSVGDIGSSQIETVRWIDDAPPRVEANATIYEDNLYFSPVNEVDNSTCVYVF